MISSPRLNTEKVERIISERASRQELGVKVTVVTWHYDAYKYGRDDVRMELMEKLRKAGFEVKLVEDNCEHYAIIDNKVVWYGSMLSFNFNKNKEQGVKRVEIGDKVLFEGTV